MELKGTKKVLYCPRCSEPCSRAWNLKIHIQRKHHWIGESVRSGLMTNTRQFTPDTRNFINSLIAIDIHSSKKPVAEMKNINLGKKVHETFRKR